MFYVIKQIKCKRSQTRFGVLLDMAQRRPVTVEKNGRPIVVVLSIEDFSYYEKLEDEILALKARQAEQGGWLNPSESANFLAKLGIAKQN